MTTITGQVSRSAAIAATLRTEILTGQYRAGERLPSERDLSERFGVSRGAVREALKQLQQIGIASIQPGGARVAPLTACSLDVLGPLLEVSDIPDAKLVDEVMHVIGVLLREAALAATDKASDAEIETARARIDELLAHRNDPARQFAAVRGLGELFIDVADHLVLRLIVNGLRTSFLARIGDRNLMSAIDGDAIEGPARRIQTALSERNAGKLGDAMLELNRLFREAAKLTLAGREADSTGTPE